MRIQAPRLTGPSLTELEIADPDQARDPAGTDGCRIEHADLDGLRRQAVTYRETELVRAHAAQARFTECRFLDVRFDALDAPDLVASGSTWRDVEIVGSRLGTFGLYEATVSGVRFDRCKIGFLGLLGATVHDVVVEHCVVEEVDLSDATATRVAFHDTSIGQLRLSGARLSHVDLRSARLGLVDPVAGLRGAVVTVEQILDLAPSLATELGIVLG